MAYIGIVVPVYKIKQEYFEQCVESLLNQTFRDIQIILVDDCSPDNCGALCDEYAQKDSRVIVVHHEKNRGLPSARNSGIDKLDAEWVSFVDGDDWVDLDMCMKLADYLTKLEIKPDVVIFSGYKNYPELEEKSQAIYENDTWFDTYDSICGLQKKSLSFVRKGYPSRSLTLDSACWKIISVSYMRKKGIRFIDVPYREDGLFFLYLTEQAERIVYLYETFYHYRSTGNSMVNMYRKNADKEHQKYISEVLSFVERFSKDEEWMKDFHYAVLVSMQICITQKFFNKENPEPFLKRQKACLDYFKNEPYRSVFKMIDIGALSRNHYVKAMCIKYHWYAGVALLRNSYLKMNRKESYN
jgi:glycosyltransferase involved in cell wall biosynthesis